MRVCCSLCLTLLLGVGTASAQEEPLITDRPDFTESPVAVQPGRVQLETGYTFEEAGIVETQSLGEVLLRIGISEAIELRLGVNSYQSEESPGGDSSGLEDSSLGLKIELSQGGDEVRFLEPAAALLITTTLSTGSEELGEPHLGPGMLLALNWPLGESWGVAANLGLSYVSDGGEQFAEARFSLAMGADLGGPWGGFIEYFDSIRESAGGGDRHFANAGLTYLLSADLQLDLRAGIELEGETAYFAGLGLAYRL